MIEPLSEMPSPPAHWVVGGGELGELICARDWSATPLGPLESWPPTLRSAVNLMLASKAQIILFWGDEFVTLYNDAYRPVFGAKHPAALGMPARQCWSEIWHMLEPLLRSVLITGESFWAQNHLFVIERHGYVEETYFDVSYDPLRDGTGRIRGLFCIVSETTGRMVGERRLAALRDLGGISAGAASVGDVLRNAAAVLERYRKDIPFIAAYGWDSREHTGTLAATMGLAASELDSFASNAWPIGGAQDMVTVECPQEMRLHDAPWPEPVTQAVVLKLATPGHEPYGYLVAGISPHRPFDADYRDFLRLVASHVGSAVAGIRALEDQRRRAEALAELDRAKTAFFSNVSHEFRTPITLMLGPLEDLIARGESISPVDRALLATAQNNGRRLLRLVNTLLDFARIEAGRSQASYQPTDIAALTVDLASNFRSACERAGIGLVVDCPTLPEPVYVDPLMWEKIVLNLISNAFKFTFEGEIGVRLRDAGSSVELVVSDTGTGIPENELPRMFERFHRIENVRSRSHEGSGIGLALVSELVKLHGGSITARSQSGVGTTFTVSIPKGSAHLPSGQVHATIQPPPSNGAGADAYVAEAMGWLPANATTFAQSPQGASRVLIADDNADLREYAGRLLGEYYEVHTVADGRAALEAAKELKPHIIVTDIMMPNLDGFGLIRELRADEELRGIPVLVLSARAGEEARLEGICRGADDYLVKPFSARELLVRVGALLRSAQLRLQAIEAREALREADRRKDEFLATLSHELRNPLAPLRSSLDILKRVGMEGRHAATTLEIMERQLSHLVRLVDDLLEVSRITRGTIELRKVSVRLDFALRNALEASEPLMRAGNHRLTVTIPEEPIFIDADPVRIAQIFGNLLNNAAKYSDRNGEITVEVRREADEAVVDITDKGDGIDPAQLSNLFEIFMRGERSSRRHQSGLGIGLALVRRMTEMHGGRVEAHSDGVGSGSRFTVRLPVSGAKQAMTVREQSTGKIAPLRVLVIDDNQDAAESLAMLLRVMGADVRVAHDGATGLSEYEEFQPRVVLLDIGMPGTDGYEVARRIRAQSQRARTVIVALTGWGQDDDRSRAREAGFDQHLVKPADSAALQVLFDAIRLEQA